MCFCNGVNLGVFCCSGLTGLGGIILRLVCCIGLICLGLYWNMLGSVNLCLGGGILGGCFLGTFSG